MPSNSESSETPTHAKPRLTPAQERYLADIRAAGREGKRYNGRALRPLDRLVQLGLITYDLDIRGVGGMMKTSFVITAKAKP